MKHLLKEGVWQCAGTIANASNHCKYKAKEKRNLVSHIQQEHLADKVDNILFCLSLLKLVSPFSLSGVPRLQVSRAKLRGSSLLSQLPRSPSS